MAVQNQQSVEYLAARSRLLEAIEREGPYMEFISSVRSPASKNNYRQALARYMLAMGFKSTNDMIGKHSKLIQTDVLKYVVEEKHLSRNSMQTHLAILKTFYVQNDVLDINWKKVKSRLGEIQKTSFDRAYTAEEIKHILDTGCNDLRSKALILLLSSSAMRIAAPAGILMKHMQYHEKEGVYSFKVYAGFKEEYTAFCSREAARVIKEYLNYRERSGERLLPTSPLFREQFDVSDEEKVSKPMLLDVSRLKKIVYDALVRSGIRTVRHRKEGERFGTIRHDVAANNGFKKFANTAFATAGLPSIMVESLVGGPQRAGLQKHYLRASEKELLEQYMKAEHMLTIDPANRLQQQVETLTNEKDQLIRSLNNRVEKMEHLAMAFVLEQNLKKERPARMGVEEARALIQSGRFQFEDLLKQVTSGFGS